MKKLNILKISVIFFTCLCAFLEQVHSAYAQKLAPKIVNGHDADVGEYNWMTSLFYLGDQKPFCGASLISPNYILTAAHCVNGLTDSLNNIIVIIGRTDLANFSSGVSVGIDQVMIHPDYNPQTYSSDIALIHLKNSVNIFVPRIIQPNETSLIQGGLPSTIIGFGVLSFNSTLQPDILKEADIPIISDDTCFGYFGSDFIRNTMLCAGILATSINSFDGVDSCQGDSGGPLFTRINGETILLGLVSWGIGCAGSTPGVYTRLISFYDWIATAVNGGVVPVFNADKTPPIVSKRDLHCKRKRCELVIQATDNSSVSKTSVSAERICSKNSRRCRANYNIQGTQLTETLWKFNFMEMRNGDYRLSVFAVDSFGNQNNDALKLKLKKRTR